MRWHRDSYDFEGYGVYEFVDQPLRGYGDLPAGVSVEDIVKNMDDYIIVVGGIQVAKTEVQQPVMDVLDKMDFAADGDDAGVTVTGTASFGIGSFLGGSDFASDYLEDGYAILAQKESIKTGTARMLLTQIASVIAQNAMEGGPYVVVAAPATLLQQASASLTQPALPPAQPPAVPPPGTSPPVYTPPAQQPAQAAVGAPEWMLPAVVAVGGLALIAAFAAVGSRPKKRGAR